MEMPLSYGLAADNDNPDVFMPSYSGKRKRSRVSSTESALSNYAHGDTNSLNLFDKEQLAKLLIHALRELGYENSALTLQRESGGIQVESTVVQKLFNIIRTGKYERVTLALLSQLPSKYGTLFIDGIQDSSKSFGGQFGTAAGESHSANDEEGSMKIENIISQGTDWQKIVVKMEQELKNFENLLQVTGKTLHSQTAVQLITIVEIMVLINREIFLELVFDQNDSPSAVLFLRNILRKYIQLWDSLLSLENEFLDDDATFTPENLLRELTTVLTSPMESSQRSSMWKGSLARSRETLIEEISDYVNPNDLVPRGRLLTLLKQAIRYQRSQDVFSISDDNDNDLDDQIGEGNDVKHLEGAGPHHRKFNLLQDNTYNFQQIKFVEEKTLVQNVDEIWYLQFSPNGKYLASASSDSLTDRKIMIYDVENDFQVYKVLAGNDQCILYLSFSPDSRYIVSCPFNEMANIYDIHSKGEPTNINPAVQNGIIAEVIQPIDSFQISGTLSSSGADANNCGAPPRIWCCDWFHTPEHRGRFIVGSPDREVAIYDMNKKTVLFKLSTSTATSSSSISGLSQTTVEQFPRVHDLKITSDDKYLVLMPHQGNIDVYDLSQFPNNQSVDKNEVSMDNVSLPRISHLPVQRRMTCISLPQTQNPESSLSSLLLVSLQSNELQLWDFKEQILLQKYFGQRQEQFIIRSCFGYNNKLIASGSEDGKVFLWDRINGNIVGVLTAHVADRPVPTGSNKKFGKNCNVVVWSPVDKALFASGGDDGYIKIWKVARE
ncbi:GID7 (YCL039W) [Zygosaccharomyces parabailii]|nr:GID7 (YCL039W) [Zygosaccharomyces parabailii]